MVDLVATERLIAGDRVIGLEYESGADTVCLALHKGDVLTFNTHSHEVTITLSQLHDRCQFYSTYRIRVPRLKVASLRLPGPLII